MDKELWRTMPRPMSWSDTAHRRINKIQREYTLCNMKYKIQIKIWHLIKQFSLSISIVNLIFIGSKTGLNITIRLAYKGCTHISKSSLFIYNHPTLYFIAITKMFKHFLTNIFLVSGKLNQAVFFRFSPSLSRVHVSTQTFLNL